MIGFRNALRPQQIAGRLIGWRPFVIEPDFSLVNLWKGIWRTFGMPPRMMASARRTRRLGLQPADFCRARNYRFPESVYFSRKFASKVTE